MSFSALHRLYRKRTRLISGDAEAVCARGYNPGWDGGSIPRSVPAHIKRPSISAVGCADEEYATSSVTDRPVSTHALDGDNKKTKDDEELVMPIHLVMLEVYPHFRQTDSSFFLFAAAVMQFWRACMFLHGLGLAESRVELWRSPYPYFMVMIKTFVWGPLIVFTTVATTISVPLLLETTNANCKPLTPTEMKSRALFVATYGAVTFNHGVTSLIKLGKALMLLACESSIPNYPEIKLIHLSTACLCVLEIMATLIILVQAYLLIWASDTLLNSVLNGLALSIFFDIDNYIGAAAITMAGAPFSRYYQPHVSLQRGDLQRAKGHARYLLSGPGQLWMNFATRRITGVFLVFYAWTESMYIPIFFNTFLYAYNKDPLDSCSWTSVWIGMVAALRSRLSLF